MCVGLQLLVPGTSRFFLPRNYHEVDQVSTDYSSDAPNSVSRVRFAPRETFHVFAENMKSETLSKCRMLNTLGFTDTTSHTGCSLET